MLVHSTHNQFATNKLSPERERRLVCVTTGNGWEGLSEDQDNSEEPTRKQQGPEEGNAQDIAQGFHKRITKGVLSKEVMEETLKMPAGIIAVLEYDNTDLRKKVEERMRAEDPKYYADQEVQEHLPMHEIIWFLRDNEIAAEELREVAMNRLNAPEALLQFSHNLQLQVRKLQDLEESLSNSHIGLRIGSIDIERFRATEKWLYDLCTEHGLSIGTPNIGDWLDGQYKDFQPEEAEKLKVIHYITGKEEALPERPSFDTTGAPNADRLKERLDNRIGKTIPWVNMFRSAGRTILKRKIFGLFLEKEKPKEDEDVFASRTLQGEVFLLQSHILEIREVVSEQLMQRGRIVYDQLNRDIVEKFGNVNADSAVHDFGTSQVLLKKVIDNTIQDLEKFLIGPQSATDGAFETRLGIMLEKIEELTQNNVLEEHLAVAQKTHEDTILWATTLERNGDIAVAIQAIDANPPSFAVQQMPTEQRKYLRHYLPAVQRIGAGTATGDDYDTVELYRQDANGVHQIETLLYTLTHRQFDSQLEQQVNAYESSSIQNTQTERENIRSRYEGVQGRFANNPTLSNEVCSVLGVQKELENVYSQIGSDLRFAEKYKQQAGAAQHLKQAQDTVQRLEDAEKLLREIDTHIIHCNTPQEFIDKGAPSGEGAAGYNVRSNEILLNVQYIDKKGLDTNEQIAHETGHAITNILTRQTGLFSGLLLGIQEKLNSIVPENQIGLSEISFRELLDKQAIKWGVNRSWEAIVTRAKLEAKTNEEANQLAKENYQDLLMDELLNQYASWKRKGKADKEELILFEHIQNTQKSEKPIPLNANVIDNTKLPAEFLYNLGDSNDDDDPDGDDQDEDVSESGDTSERLDANEKFAELRIMVNKINFFYESFPEYKNVLEPIYTDYKKALQDTEQQFQTGKISEHAANEFAIRMSDQLDDLLKEIGEIKNQKSNISNAKPSGRKGLQALVGNINLYSIMDVYKTITQAGEDMKRYWERRGAAKQAALGLGLTKWIPAGMPYAGRLQDEFYRRDKESEQKEVNEWKEKFEEFDSYDLMDKLGTVLDKDQIKAMFFILTDRGRMDWNNERVWKTLNAISLYDMPIEACRHDDILRDRWLRKLIDNIWNDKDLYTQWRQKNDSATESGKKEFTATVDQLSNISGGLSAELKHQLELWQEKKDTGKTSPDINPHLYEEIIDYSMRNGKMSMEEKLYYLVKGVADGILSIDRLRTLAGEKGGVLNIYPWIDYFYGKNNSLQEVKALAKRLTESSDQPFKPGYKTTLWLHLENMRSESARQRISKAISGTRAEGLDHEDIPSLVSQADWVNIDRMTGMVSGTREKLSPEAVKNAYTGFGTKFKVLAHLALMEEEGVAQFTDKDASEAAKSIVAYIHMDNIFTRNASKGDRPQLTWDVIDTQQGPSTTGLVVGDYRNPQNEFVTKILSEIGTDFWNSVGVDDEERKTLIRSSDKSTGRNDLDGKTQEERYEKYTKKVFGKLQAELAKHPDRLKELLIDYAGKFKEENYAKKSDTDVDNHHINKKKMRTYFHERFASNIAA